MNCVTLNCVVFFGSRGDPPTRIDVHESSFGTDLSMEVKFMASA